MKRALVWLRRDLRLHDHAVIAEAEHLAEDIAIAFILDTTILRHLPKDDHRITFFAGALRDIDRHLRERESHLIVRSGDPTMEIPKLAKELNAEVVITAQDFEPAAIARDQAIAKTIDLRLVRDHIVLGDFVLKPDGSPYQVFTPYSKAWRATVSTSDLAERVVTLKKLLPSTLLPASDPIPKLGRKSWLEPGLNAAQTRLKEFETRLHDYATERDRPDLNTTSHLSADLRFGTLSPRECFRLAQRSEKWKSELIWREFYSMILSRFPHVVEEPFERAYKDLKWPGKESHFDAWRNGQTGFPIVDAAIRCLNETGWMHNRLRMVTASFLTKDLLIDYRKGEAHFALNLLDFDLASNNGGWQWAASTGCDSQPYFRIFNPNLQSAKFDPEAEFIRAWCPELAGLSAKVIHAPIDPNEGIAKNYPCPIVDHAVQRNLAIKLLKKT